MLSETDAWFTGWRSGFGDVFGLLSATTKYLALLHRYIM
jgi:hypothetical protein